MDNADYGKARYQWLKAHGICVSCGNADAEPGRVRCERCLQVRRDLSSAWKRKNPERVKAYQQTYQPLYRQRTYLPGAGQLVTNRKPKIHKPDGTCRRKGWSKTEYIDELMTEVKGLAEVKRAYDNAGGAVPNESKRAIF